MGSAGSTAVRFSIFCAHECWGGKSEGFIVRWRLFSFVFEEVTVGVGKVLELLNEVQSGFRLRLVQVEFCKKVFPFKIFDESVFGALESFCSMSFSGHSFGSRHGDWSWEGEGFYREVAFSKREEAFIL